MANDENGNHPAPPAGQGGVGGWFHHNAVPITILVAYVGLVTTFLAVLFDYIDLRAEVVELSVKLYVVEMKHAEEQLKHSELREQYRELEKRYSELVERCRETSGEEIVIPVIPLPLPIDVDLLFYPSGWMGDGEYGRKYIGFRRMRGDVIEITYAPEEEGLGWGGIRWQYPDGNEGEQPGRDLTGVRKLTFKARGARGGEIVEFEAGGTRGHRYVDSFEVSLGRVELSADWESYEIDLSGQDLSSVIGAFAWVATRDLNPDGLTFYLKDIYFE
jgi:hypothetical protein